MQNKLKKILPQFSKVKLGIIGDLMLDEWIIGPVERVSPEAPIPVVRWEEDKETVGGACNTAINATSLNGKVYLFGLVGKDPSANKILSLLQKIKVDTSAILADQKKPTIRKIRVVGKRGPEQQIVRIDKEDKTAINGTILKNFLNNFEKNLKKLDLVIFSDYDKGFITEKLAQKVIQLCQKANKYTIVDTKPAKMAYFQGCSLITPNLEEASEMSGIKIDNQNNKSVEKAGRILQKKLNCDCIITRSEKGMSVFENKNVVYIPTEAQEVYDVSGAGDTVVALLGLAIASGANLEQAARLANKAAGIVVGKTGTASVTKEELENAI